MDRHDYEFYNCDVIDIPSDNEFNVESDKNSREKKNAPQPKFPSLFSCDMLDLSSSEDEAIVNIHTKNDQQSQSERALSDLVSAGKNLRLDAEFQQMLMKSETSMTKSASLDDEFRRMIGSGSKSRQHDAHQYSQNNGNDSISFEQVNNLNYAAIDTLLKTGPVIRQNEKVKTRSSAKKRKIKLEKVEYAYADNNNARSRPRSTRRISAPVRYDGSSDEDNDDHNGDFDLYNDTPLDNNQSIITVAPKTEEFVGGDYSKNDEQSASEKRHVCEFCLKRFRLASHLREHRRVHTNEKPFSCNRCNRRFRQRSHLNVHIKRDKCKLNEVKHGDENEINGSTNIVIGEYNCEECDNTFKDPSDLKKHRHFHNENKPFECDICGRGFTQDINLFGHQKICTGITTLTLDSFESRKKGPPYICEFCGKEFKAKGHLRDHRRIHTNERPFQCLTCTRAFKQSSGLRSHMKICKGVKSDMKTPQKSNEASASNGLSNISFESNVPDEDFGFDESDEKKGSELGVIQTQTTVRAKLKLTAIKRKFKSAAQLAKENGENPDKNKTAENNVSEIGENDGDDSDFHAPDNESEAESSSTEIENDDSESNDKRKSKPKKRITLKLNLSRVDQKSTLNKNDNAANSDIKEKAKAEDKRPYSCVICYKAFKTRQILREHVRRHTQERPYSCPYCNESFLQHNACIRHMQRFHSRDRLAAGIGKYVEEYKLRVSKLIDEVMAQFNFGDDNLNNIALKYTIWTSTFCGLKENEDPGDENRDKITKVLSGIVQEGEDWKCNICEMKSRRRHILVRHVLRHFDDSKSGAERTFFCEFCGRAFKTRQHFNDHVRTHTGERPHQCRYCPKRYITMTSVREHEVRAHKVNPKPFKCTFCAATFRHQKNMDRHTTKHLSEPTEQKMYQCEICSKTFKWAGSLKMHTMYHLGIKPYVCKQCPAKFVMKGHLLDHVRSHSNERPYQCHVCGASFKQRSALTAHKVTHTGKSIQCNICAKMFNRKNDYEFHMMKHNGIQPYACEICGERFIRRGGLTRHEALHKDPNRFECSICHRNFKSRLKLDGHAWFHQNGPRFHCDQCDVVVPTKIRLDKHKFNKHSDVKNFACRFCDMRFKGGTAQRLHEKSKHKKEWEASPFVHEPPRPPGNRGGNRQHAPQVPRLEHPIPQSIPPPVQLPPPQENVLNLHQGLFIGNHMGWDRPEYYGV